MCLSARLRPARTDRRALYPSVELSACLIRISRYNEGDETLVDTLAYGLLTAF